MGIHCISGKKVAVKIVNRDKLSESVLLKVFLLPAIIIFYFIYFLLITFTCFVSSLNLACFH